MRARSRWFTVAAVLGATLLGSRAQAAPGISDGVRIDQLQPASPESVFFRAEGPHAPFTGGVEFAAGLSFEYGKGLLKEAYVYKDGSRQTAATLIEHALLTRVAGSITPLHWLSFDVSLPVALLEVGDDPVALDKGKGTPPAAHAPGVGDLRFGVHFRAIDTKELGLILGGRVWAPFGTQSSYLSDKRFRGEVDIGVAGEASRLLWGCTLNIAPTFFARRNGDHLAASCALHVKLGEVVSLGLEPSFALVTHTDLYPFSGDKNVLEDGKPSLGVLFEPLGALRLRFGGFRVGVAAGPGFGGGMGAAELRGIVNLAYVGLGKPPPPVAVGPSDRDLDKIPDSQDACPDEAGPASQDPKTNGCPSRDRDGDAIRDDEDFCPDRPGIPHPDPKANGCPDTDNDGLPDPIDKCVNEPGPAPDGCPKHAHLVTGAFKIDPPIEFGAGEKLSGPGRAALEEVAATMRANPTIGALSVSVGTKGAKSPLSDKRAQELLAILRGTNLDTARFEVVMSDDLRGGAVTVKIVKK